MLKSGQKHIFLKLLERENKTVQRQSFFIIIQGKTPWNLTLLVWRVNHNQSFPLTQVTGVDSADSTKIAHTGPAPGRSTAPPQGFWCVSWLWDIHSFQPALGQTLQSHPSGSLKERHSLSAGILAGKEKWNTLPSAQDQRVRRKADP